MAKTKGKGADGAQAGGSPTAEARKAAIRAGLGREARPQPGGDTPRTLIYRWGIVRTKAGHEKAAKGHIERQGFKCFNPRVKQTRSPVLTAMFPGYLFVQLAGRWHSLRSTIGVMGVIMSTAEKPAKLPKGFVEGLIKLCDEGGGYCDVSGELPLRLNGPVEVLKGPFKNHIAVYIGASPEQRVNVLLQFMGRDVEMTLKRNDVRAL